MEHFIAGFEKQAFEFYHRTSNLDPILESGKVLSLRHLAQREPEKIVSVEPERWSRERKDLPASEAYEAMKQKKDVDYIFLTKNAPLAGGDYGKYVIKKDLKTPEFAKNLNLIPNEYKQKRPLSVRHNAEIFVPREEMEGLQKKHPGYKFKDISEIHEHLPNHSLTAFGKKLIANMGVKVGASLESMSEAQLRKFIAAPAHISGSAALGIATRDSDKDIFVPFKRKSDFERAKERLIQKFPELKPSPHNKPDGDKFVLTSPKVDIALAYGPNAMKRMESVFEAKARLTRERAEEIRKHKEELKNAWLFPQTRYKRYKREVDKELGLYKW